MGRAVLSWRLRFYPPFRRVYPHDSAGVHFYLAPSLENMASLQATGEGSKQPFAVIQGGKSTSRDSVHYAPCLIIPSGQISTVLLAALQFAVLVLWSTSASSRSHRTKASIPTAAVSFIAALGVCILSWFEHRRSVRPSALLDIYLFLSVLFDIARARTLWLIRHDPALAAVFTSTIALRCVMITFESYEKRSILKTQYKSYPPDAISGPFNRGVFWWLSSLFLRGYSNILSLDDLFPLQKSLQSERIFVRFQQAWDKGQHYTVQRPQRYTPH